MPRYAFQIEYNGSPFRGWQTQAGLPTVQGTLQAALAKLEQGFDRVYAAGRTDTGVHAWGQVAHVDATKAWVPFRLMEAVNYHLKPAPIAVVRCAEVSEAFHARFSATARHYVFRVLSRRAPAVLEMERVWQVKQGLSLAPMQEAAAHLLGTHDFTTFRASECQAKSPVKTLDCLEISAHPLANGCEFRFDVRARSFLHNQVRSFVGTLERVGAGGWPPERVREALQAQDRAACGPVAPPSGLYLAKVVYPDDPFA